LVGRALRVFPDLAADPVRHRRAAEDQDRAEVGDDRAHVEAGGGLDRRALAPGGEVTTTNSSPISAAAADPTSK
jgi:hypothetical protein